MAVKLAKWWEDEIVVGCLEGSCHLDFVSI